MKTLIALSQSDFRSTFRDPVFRGILFAPVMVLAIIRWGYPLVASQYPAVVPYSIVILMWACLQTSVMFGFLYGFLILEEKEERLWEVIQVLPVSGVKLIFSRLLLGLIISVIINFCLIEFGNIIETDFIKSFLIAFIYSLTAPVIALAVGALSKNRIEGMAQMKIFNLLLIIPALMYFFPSDAFHLTAFIPSYWLFRVMEKATTSGSFIPFFAIALFYHFAIIFFLNYMLRRSR